MIDRGLNTNPGTRIICEWCGKVIISRRKRFCDKMCRAYWVSNNTTEDIRRRISETLVGHDVSEETRELISKNTSKAMLDYKYDPKKAEPYRAHAIEYYGYECSVCGRTVGLLQVHHINGDHLDDRIENLVVLCCSCHAKAHFVQNEKGQRIGGHVLNENFLQIILDSRNN